VKSSRKKLVKKQLVLENNMLKRKIRHKRIRSKVSGTSSKPRLSVFRSAKRIYAQIIDDQKQKTLVSVKGPEAEKKTVSARLAGEMIAQKALEKKITQVVFDRGGYKYHGRVKELAEGARSKGLKF
jgi:large subunit ribosomal protein L18